MKRLFTMKPRFGILAIIMIMGFQSWAQPANNDCGSAQTLTVGASCVTTAGTTVDATQSISPILCAGFTAASALDVWYQFVATAANINVTVVGDINFDAVIDIRSGACDGTNLACADATTAGGIETAALTGLTIGNTYYIRLYDYTGTATFTICVNTPPPPPVNDNCAGAIGLTVNPDFLCASNASGTTVSATQSTETAPSCSATGVNDDVWYSFVATGVAHRVNISGATITTAAAVYTGLCGSLTQITGACTTTSSGSLNINLTGLTAGTTYLVRVYSSVATVGTTSNFNICIGTPPPPPSNDNCAGAIAFPTIPLTGVCADMIGNTDGATQSQTACAGSGADDDIWFSFVAPGPTVLVTLTAISGSADRVHQIFSGSCGALASVTCSDPETSTTNGLIAGNTYYIRVHTYGTGTNTIFNLCLRTPPPPPSNDNCVGSIAFPAIPTNGTCVDMMGNTGGATQSQAACTGPGADDDIWFSFVAPGPTVLVTLTAISGTSDRVHQIFSGSCGALVSVTCSDPETSTTNGLITGNTYYIRVHTYGTGTNTVFNLCLRTPTPPPVNDECAGALSVTVNPPGVCTSQTAGTIVSATASAGAPSVCLGTPDDDVWFRFVATTASASISLNNVTGSTSDLVHQVLSGVCGSQVQVTCSDPNTSTATGLTIGQTYYIRVFTWTATANQTTTFNVCVSEIPPPPGNDNCVGAITISGCQSITGTTIGATGDGLTSTCGTTVSSTAQGVWYRFVGDGNPAEVNTCSGTSFDTKIQVFSGSCASLVCVGGNDDNCSTQSRVNWTSAIGVTYFIYVYPFTNPGGNFELNLISGPPCAAPAPAASNVSSTSASINWPATAGAVNYTYSFGTGSHTCGTGAVSQAGTSVNLSNLIPNTNYTFCVRTNCACGSSTYSTVSFTTAPLSNDACAGAIPLVCNSTITGSTLGAQSDAAMGICSTGTGGTPGNGVWYSLAGDGSQITLDLCGSAYDTKIHVYSGACGTLTCETSNDNSAVCGSNRSHVVFNTAPGTTYYILVSGLGSATGSFSLNVGCVCGAPLSFPWSNDEIGAVTGEGIDNVCGGSIDISSTGYSPTLSSDALFFSNQTLCGNQSITVKVQSVTNGGFAGIMFRDTVSAGSRFVAIKTQLNPFVHRELRTTTNGNRISQQLQAPGHTWLRLTRSGNTFSGFTSSDGITWRQAFLVSVPLNSCLRVGLFAQGLNPSSTAQAQFSMISGFPDNQIGLPNINGNINESTYGLTVFPNPTSNELNLKIGSEFIGKEINIQVMDQMGRVVLQKNINELQTQQEQINVSQLPGGMYVISLMTEGQAAQIQKFIVSGNRP